MAEDVRDDWIGLMHWLYIIAFAWLVALLLQPQATLAGTLTAWLLVWEKLYLWFV